MQSMPTNDSRSGTVSDGKAVVLARKLIREKRVMTLATTSTTGIWTAPVYYCFHGSRFYFFSNSMARHITKSRGSDGSAAASIFSDSISHEKIKGIQMAGKIIKINSKTEAVKTAGAYLKKFFSDFTGHDGLTYIKKQFNADLYAFVSHESLYMDNGICFGFRERIQL